MNAYEKPVLIEDGINIRRVLEWEEQKVIALSDDTILLLEKGGRKGIESEITNRIESLYLVEEEPLNILVGCTPPNLYRLKEHDRKAFRKDYFDGHAHDFLQK